MREREEREGDDEEEEEEEEGEEEEGDGKEELVRKEQMTALVAQSWEQRSRLLVRIGAV